jgi:hypothetical protein
LKWEREAEKAVVGAALGLEEGTMATLTSGLASKTNWMIMSLFFVAENSLRYS